jgi:ribonuclease D
MARFVADGPKRRARPGLAQIALAMARGFVHDPKVMVQPQPAPTPLPAVYVDDTAGLRAVCRELAAEERFGLDTEFVGERTYVPQLELVQVATRSQCALIDCQLVRSLDPFFELLWNEKIEKVVHAGQQDLELFCNLTGRMPVPVVDTQLAAAMVGYGAQAGYAQLVERLLGVSVDKSETLTDWSRRPLTEAQFAYAADDVRFLLPLYDRLRAKLSELGRWSWVLEECRRLEGATRSEPLDPAEAYLRVRGRGSLRAKGLVVLRELAAWREDVARQRNKPRATIARDEALVEIARKAPTSVAGLRSLRAVRSRELDRQSEAVVERVRQALETPRDQWPQPPPTQGPTPSTGVVELLQAVLRLRADEACIAPSMLATHADLMQLVQRHAAGEGASLPIMQGWRRKIAGADLLALLEGRATLALDPERGRVRVRIDGGREHRREGRPRPSGDG